MAEFNRFDIIEAHCLLEWDYNLGGWLQERPSNQRRRRATAVQLKRMNFKPRANLSFETLEENSKEIYLTNVLKWGLDLDSEMKSIVKAFFAEDWLKSEYPEVHTKLYA